MQRHIEVVGKHQLAQQLVHHLQEIVKREAGGCTLCNPVEHALHGLGPLLLFVVLLHLCGAPDHPLACPTQLGNHLLLQGFVFRTQRGNLCFQRFQ